jgi:hypothetical protein
MSPPSGFKSSEFTLVTLVGAVIQPLLAYIMAQKGQTVAGYFALIGSTICAVAYTISRWNIKTAWLSKAVQIASEVGQDLQDAAAEKGSAQQPTGVPPAAPAEPPPLPAPPGDVTARNQLKR